MNKIEDELRKDGLDDAEVKAKLIDYYNKYWHAGENEETRNKARVIRYHIRLHHQYGILLRKRMIDKDLLFSVIGLNFEIDYDIMRKVLDAHREYHKITYMYNHFEYLWERYKKWKRKSRLLK